MGRTISFLAMILLLVASSAQAQQYPEHPVRVIVGYAAGSGPDIQARTVAAQLSASLGQQFFVENRLGANGTIAARSVAQSKPDGYTLLFSSSSIAPTPYIYKNLGYDLFSDLEPIASVGILDGLLMLVDVKSPIKSLQEFIAYAKKERVVYGTPGVGNILHLATEKFSKAAGISMQHVPYKGASEVMTALLGGSVQVMIVSPPSTMGLLKDGRIRALAFTGTKPFPPYPDVPLMKDVLPGFAPMGSWGMFFAPGKTPKEIVDKLNCAIQQALQVPSVASVMARDGYVPDHRNAAATAAFFRKEVEQMAEAVKAAGIQPN
ncbi:MAG: tripartite tricarboxylate transporter substrate binding protein [Rhizobiales bacterium]|nr:tripartite tricarboxylate transporter substrate binding protein [Hyphomicrobiales bacterium]